MTLIALPHARRRTRRLRAGTLAALLLMVLAAALAPLPAQAQIQARSQTGVVLTSVRGLDFGRFAVAPGAGGSVVVAANGMRSSTGGVILLGAGGGAAVFHLERGAGAAPQLALSLSLPAGQGALLSNGAQRMAARALQAFPASVASLPDGGIDVAIGATLDVAAGQAAGNYAGTFSLTVNYE